MELALKQLENYVASIADADREAAVKCLRDLMAILGRYKLTLSAGALLKVASSAGVAHATDGMEKWWARLCAKAKETGPYVGAIFSAE